MIHLRLLYKLRQTRSPQRPTICFSAMNRREFLLSTAAIALAPRTSLGATARIEILPEEPIGTISPLIYGHFTEHLGGCIYDGI